MIMSDDDCWVGEGNHGSKCFEGQCKIPNGNVCSMSNAYDMTLNGGAYEGCQSGWCLSSIIVRDEPVCGTFISYGSGCVSDDDCWLGEGNHGSKCFGGQCKIPNGNVCSFEASNYNENEYGGSYDGCESGFCLSDELIKDEPSCGTVGDYGSGCNSDSDCPTSAYECKDQKCELKLTLCESSDKSDKLLKKLNELYCLCDEHFQSGWKISRKNLSREFLKKVRYLQGRSNRNIWQQYFSAVDQFGNRNPRTRKVWNKICRPLRYGRNRLRNIATRIDSRS